jgi:ribosomal-protein-serine acetyltransferase
MQGQPRAVLKTARLRLEPVSAIHAEGLYQAALASRAQLLPWMPWARDITLKSNREYVAEAEGCWTAGKEFHFAVTEDDLVLGVIGLNRDGDRSAELHYWIRSDRTGRGYTTEAGERILRWGAEQLDLQTFTLWAGVDNRSSRRVAEKLGFRDVGPLPHAVDGGLGSFRARSYRRPARVDDGPGPDAVKPLHG